MQQDRLFQVAPNVKRELNYTNLCYLNVDDYKQLSSISAEKFIIVLKKKEARVLVNGEFVFNISPDLNLVQNHITFNPTQLRCLGNPETVRLSTFDPTSIVKLKTIQLLIVLEDLVAHMEIVAGDLRKFLRQLLYHQVFKGDQWICFRYKDVDFNAIVVGSQIHMDYGLVGKKTEILFHVLDSTRLNVVGAEEHKSVFHDKFNLKDLDETLRAIGVGGMTEIVEKILIQGFTSRLFHPLIAKRLKLKNKKGLLLHGPPGSGKTFLAMKICKLIDSKEPVIINGLEVLNRYYGETEKQIRSLFEVALRDYEAYGEQSPLHVIIIDELDSIAPKLGTHSGGLEDRLVNQLLTMIEGTNSPNNLFIIGTTNRKELIDSALLREGRLEMDFHLDYPGEVQRLDMLKILSKNLVDVGMLKEEVNLEEIAALTEGCSCATLHALLTDALSVACWKDGIFHRDAQIGNADITMALQNLLKKRAGGFSNEPVEG